jgi:CRISPR-associated protein Cas1
MYGFRFQEEPPARRSIDQMRGLEGVRVRTMYKLLAQQHAPRTSTARSAAAGVRTMYKLLAQQHGIPWDKREYDPGKFHASDVVNRCLSVANHCLHGLCEAAILAAGYAPAIGFLHTGKPLPFVYDIADLFKFETFVRIAFKVVAAHKGNPERETRLYCRNSFRKHKLLKRIIPTIEEILAAGGIPLPTPHAEAMPIALPNKEQAGDAGHRT